MLRGICRHIVQFPCVPGLLRCYDRALTVTVTAQVIEFFVVIADNSATDHDQPFEPLEMSRRLCLSGVQLQLQLQLQITDLASTLRVQAPMPKHRSTDTWPSSYSYSP